eukprot:5643687-Pyramimonas_sp.AAC.1
MGGAILPTCVIQIVMLTILNTKLGNQWQRTFRRIRPTGDVYRASSSSTPGGCEFTSEGAKLVSRGGDFAVVGDAIPHLRGRNW